MTVNIPNDFYLFIIKLYKELELVLGSYPDLLYDFAGFLQPDQAVECGCYKACKEFHQARNFLRKLEVTTLMLLDKAVGHV